MRERRSYAKDAQDAKARATKLPLIDMPVDPKLCAMATLARGRFGEVATLHILDRDFSGVVSACGAVVVHVGDAVFGITDRGKEGSLPRKS